MTVHYRTRKAGQVPDYVCGRERDETGAQGVRGFPAPPSTGRSASCWSS